MRLYVPQPGEAAVLLQPWTFTLHPEHRNAEFHQALFPDDQAWGEWSGWSHGRKGCPKQITLPAGTEIVFDRVYVRQGAEDYASLTYVIKTCPIEALIGERFWSKLDDANSMDIERTTTGNPIGPFARGAYKKAFQESGDPELKQKNAQKRAGMEAAKSALAAAREHVQVLAMNANYGPIAQHVDQIITDSINAKHAAGYSSFLKNERQLMRHDMASDPYKKSDPHPWRCVTSRGPDGTVVRELRFVPLFRRSSPLGGFRLTMRGTEVLSCEPLV